METLGIELYASDLASDSVAGDRFQGILKLRRGVIAACVLPGPRKVPFIICSASKVVQSVR